MPFFSELKRRNVVRIAVGYLAGAWCLAEIADIIVPAYGLPEHRIGILITALVIGIAQGYSKMEQDREDTPGILH